MKKVLLCLLTAAALAFLLSCAVACGHYPGEVADNELEEINKVPPQEGIDGSEDLACPICHEIVEHVILPALPVSAEHPASSDDEVPDSGQAEQPAPEPEQSSQAEQPERPAQPAQPETASQAEQPEQPAQPARQETPSQAAPSDPSEEPAQSEIPTSQSGGDSRQPSSAQPPAPQDAAANERPQTGGSSSGGTGTSAGSSAGNSSGRNAGRTNTGGEQGSDNAEPEKIRTFPFRRIRMQPKPGIRAEAAGELLWPVSGTPFQSIYSD